MSLYKRGGAWWYDFIVNGVRVRESTGLSSRATAAKAEALRKAELLQRPGGQELAGTAPRFDQFALKEFAAWSENQHREHPSTHARYMRRIKVLIRFLGRRTLDSITSCDVERFKILRRKERRKHARDGRTVTAAAVNRDLAVLRILFNLAIRHKRAKTNPVTGVKFLPEHNLQMRVLSFGKEEAYLAAASPGLRDVAVLILETGMRPGEVFRLRRGDVNIELGLVQIPFGKTQFARWAIPLTQRAREVISRRIASAGGDWFFPAARDPLRPLASLKDAHEAALRRSAIEPRFRLYHPRHTALTRMAMAGIDLATLRELAGHSSIQMTMRYVHPTAEHKRAAIEKLVSFCSQHTVTSRGDALLNYPSIKASIPLQRQAS